MTEISVETVLAAYPIAIPDGPGRGRGLKAGVLLVFYIRLCKSLIVQDRFRCRHQSVRDYRYDGMSSQKRSEKSVIVLSLKDRDNKKSPKK